MSTLTNFLLACMSGGLVCLEGVTGNKVPFVLQRNEEGGGSRAIELINPLSLPKFGRACFDLANAFDTL